MHIPDGYLSPKTCVAFYGAMMPVWYIASKRCEKTLKLKGLPLLALGAAFAFVVMMFNVPVPGGSSGHMTGGAVIAVVLGPSAGVIAMSLAVAMQALFFGDGGLTTLGANAFNMAFVMSFSAYYAYRALTLGDASDIRRVLASAIAAYVSLNLAALAVGVELGLQPVLSHDALGRPLYAPYPLRVTIPAMMFTHLAFFGPIEALGTALIVSYVHKTNRGLLYGPGEARLKPLWIAVAVMIILTPLGLMATGTPFGEWGKGEIKGIVGFIPTGMDRLAETWTGVFPGYGVFEDALGVFGRAASYVLSAIAGATGVLLLVYLWGKTWPRK